MRFATFEQDDINFPGLIYEGSVIKLESLKSLKSFSLSASEDLLPFISRANNDTLDLVKNELNSFNGSSLGKLISSGDAFSLKEVRIKKPMRPTAVFCLGFNYRSHAPELNRPVPEVPVIFMKPSIAVIGPGENVVLPKAAKRVDYEVELTIVMGKGGRYITKEEAYDRVFGYTILNDITARDIQRYDFTQARPWLRSKGFDTFAPVGPFIVTQDELGNPHNLELSLAVNGEIKQKARSGEMIFDIPSIIEYISSFTTLEPGSIIATGTPENIGPIHDGDLMEAYIEKIGVLRNKVISEK